MLTHDFNWYTTWVAGYNLPEKFYRKSLQIYTFFYHLKWRRTIGGVLVGGLADDPIHGDFSDGLGDGDFPDVLEGDFPDGLEDGDFPDGLADGDFPDRLEDGDFPDGLADGDFPDGLDDGDFPIPS